MEHLIWILREGRIPCLFHELTGFYCPGCGGTRAVLALLAGHPVLSFLYHPLVPYCCLLYTSIGRIVGESAALLFTAGSGYYLPKGGMGLFRKLFESGGTMTIELYLQMAKGKYDVAFGIACVLLALVLLLSLIHISPDSGEQRDQPPQLLIRRGGLYALQYGPDHQQEDLRCQRPS